MVKSLVYLVLFFLLLIQQGFADSLPDGRRDDSGATKLQGVNLQPVTQARTAYGENYIQRRPASSHHLISAATTNATNVTASATEICSIQVFNNNATLDRYFKLVNKASAPAVGTDAVFKTIMVPHGLGVVVPYPECNLFMSLGLSYQTTAGPLDTDSAAVGASELIINIDYNPSHN